MAVYATPEQLAVWLDPDGTLGTQAPTNSGVLLRTASRHVRLATASAWYAANPDGTPSDPTVGQAFQDATCAQAAAMNAVDFDPLTGGVLTASVVTGTAIGSARIEYADAAQAASARAQLAAGYLCLEAAQILREGGVHLGQAWQTG